jgi:para-nitrobenzyl esterase
MVFRLWVALFSVLLLFSLGHCTPEQTSPGESQVETVVDGSVERTSEQTPAEPLPDMVQDRLVGDSLPESTKKANWSQAIVRTSYGLVQGQIVGSVHQFLGIPFAKAPVGPLRWKPPHKPDAWDDIKQVQAFPKPCFQVEVPNTLSFADMSEDCLQLNVWVPSNVQPGNQTLPVMVWIHGGAYNSGSTSLPSYHGKQLAASGKVIVVSIQYRLGILGFLTLSSLRKESLQLDASRLAIPSLKSLIEAKGGLIGNYGFLDQIAALHWVKQNIAAFGGDASRVTLFGESAGGGSVAHMLESPLASSLFHKAIIQSGLNRSVKETSHESDSRALLQYAFAANVPKTTPDGASELSKESTWLNSTLRNVSPSRLISESWVPWTKDGGGTLGPHIDGAILPASLAQSMFDKKTQDKPLLVGTNRNELSFFLTPEAFLRSLPATFEPVRFFDAYLASTVNNGVYPSLADAKSMYSAEPCATLPDRKQKALCVYDEIEKMNRDQFKGFAHLFALYMSESYVYEFTRISPGSQTVYATFKAAHGFEIPYVFNNVSSLDQTGAFYNQTDKELASKMSGLWLHFATSPKGTAPSVDGFSMGPYTKAAFPFTEFGQQQEKSGLLSALTGYCDKGCLYGAKVVSESAYFNP